MSANLGLQIHFPFPTFSNSTLMDGLKEVRDLGLADAVGVSNYSLAQVSDFVRRAVYKLSSMFQCGGTSVEMIWCWSTVPITDCGFRNSVGSGPLNGAHTSVHNL